MGSNLLTILTALTILLRQPHQVSHGLVELAGKTSRVAAHLAGTAPHILHGLRQATQKIRYDTHGST